YPRVNVAVQRDDEGSHLHMIRRLLALRREQPALSVGGYRRLDTAPDGCLAYVREHGAQRILVVLNFAERAASVRTGAIGRLLLHTGAPPTAAGDTVEVAPASGALLELT